LSGGGIEASSAAACEAATESQHATTKKSGKRSYCTDRINGNPALYVVNRALRKRGTINSAATIAANNSVFGSGTANSLPLPEMFP